MSRTTVRLSALTAFVLLAVGLLVGFLPVHAAGVNCGSAFVASNGLGANEIESELGLVPGAGDALSACSDARSGRLVPAVVFLVLGGGGLLFAVVAGSAVKRAPRPGPMGPYGPAGPVPPYGPPWAGPHR